MKVIGAGLPRTATTTQMIALEMLGLGPCYHMRDLLADLEGQLGFLQPRVVVTLGNFATKLLLETKDGITKLRGREFPYRDGAVLIPTFHPAAVLRGGGTALAQVRGDFVVVKRALARARAG